MVDYSFIRLKNSFSEAKNIGDSNVSKLRYYDFIQLSPNEAYLQITNVKGGISFGGDYTVDVVDCSNISLKDITNNVFIEEFINSEGENQCSIEYINIGKDFYRQTVYFRFTHTLSDLVYWSNPLNITDYQKEETTFFEYKSYNDFFGIGYASSQKNQSIRLKTYFDIPIDDTEIEDYYQISKQKTISARALENQSEQYQIDAISNFGFIRLNKLLRHDVVYIDCVRQTNKTVVSNNEREGESNFFTTNFIVSKDQNDVKEYEYQIFEGIEVLEYSPIGQYVIGNTINGFSITFNKEIDLGIGKVSLYNSSGFLLSEYDESLLSVNGNILFLTIPENMPNTEGEYYFNIEQGIVNYIGVDYEGLSNDVDWRFAVGNADFNSNDFNENDFYTA